MVFFGKKRTGTFGPTDDSGRYFTWTIPGFSALAVNTTLDSDIATFGHSRFHLHLSIDGKGNVGVYMHYKNPPIPKYAYFFENTRRQIMRQHTAHTVPADTERCGHWNVCTRSDMREFLGSDDTLRVRLRFDDDTTDVTAYSDVVTVSWTIPRLSRQNLNPFSSAGVRIGNALLVLRVDTKLTDDAEGHYDVQFVRDFVFFVFCRKGDVPRHSIELVTRAGAVYASIAAASETSTTQALIVPAHEVTAHVRDDADDTLRVRVRFDTVSNPLHELNKYSQAAAHSTTSSSSNNNNDNRSGSGSGGSARAASLASTAPATVELGAKKQVYTVVES